MQWKTKTEKAFRLDNVGQWMTNLMYVYDWRLTTVLWLPVSFRTTAWQWLSGDFLRVPEGYGNKCLCYISTDAVVLGARQSRNFQRSCLALQSPDFEAQSSLLQNRCNSQFQIPNITRILVVLSLVNIKLNSLIVNNYMARQQDNNYKLIRLPAAASSLKTKCIFLYIFGLSKTVFWIFILITTVQPVLPT